MKRTILTLLSIPILAMSLAAAPAMADDYHDHDRHHDDRGDGGGRGPDGRGGPGGRHDHGDRGGPYRGGDDGYRGGPPPMMGYRDHFGPPPPPMMGYRDRFGPPPPPPRYYRPYGYERGYRYDYYYGGSPVVIDDYDYYHVRRPPYGYRWIRDDRGNLIMVAIATGIITDLLLRH